MLLMGKAIRVLNLILLPTIAALIVGCGGTHKETSPKEKEVVVFRDSDGRTLTMDELRGLTGTFQYEIVGASKVSAEAESLHKRARQAGGSGDYKKAISLLEQASKLALEW